MLVRPRPRRLGGKCPQTPRGARTSGAGLAPDRAHSIKPGAQMDEPDERGPFPPRAKTPARRRPLSMMSREQTGALLGQAAMAAARGYRRPAGVRSTPKGTTAAGAHACLEGQGIARDDRAAFALPFPVAPRKAAMPDAQNLAAATRTALAREENK